MKMYEKLLTLFALLPAISPFSATEIVIQASPENKFILEVAPEDSFLSVMESIQEYMAILEAENSDNTQEYPIENTFRLDVELRNRSFIAAKPSKPKKNPRVYKDRLSDSEKNDITYIVTTLAKNSLIKIREMEKLLKKAGDRIDHLHPFNFIMCIITDPDLSVCFRNIHGKSWVGKDFFGALIGTLKEESKIDNLNPFINDFSAKIKIDPNAIIPSLEQQRWKDFIDVLLNSIERNEDHNRYDI